MFLESALFNHSNVEERNTLISEIIKNLEYCKFPIYFTSISEAISESPKIDSNFKINEQRENQILELFESVKNVTSKQELLYVLKRKLLSKAAKFLNCNKIFTTEVGTDLAIKLLTDFSVGRGDQACFDTVSNLSC